MNRTRWIVFILICVATLGGLVVFSKKDSVNVDNTDATKIISDSATTIGDHVYGNASSKVVLFEYGDLQCPSCGGAYPQIKTIKEQYIGQIAFVFRDFPLTTLHPNALAAATAAEAASLQGKFWEMHNKLYENQDAWNTLDTSKRTDAFVGYAKDIGLNTDTFQKDLSDPRVNEKINRDRALGKKLGINATPTFYINNDKVDAATSSDVVQGSGDQLRTKLDAALKANGITPPTR